MKIPLSWIKKIIKLFSVYIVGDLLGKGTVYLLLPFYTSYLTVDEFGILAFTKSLQPVIRILLSLGIQGAVFRYYFVYSVKARRKEFYGTIWIFILVFAGFMSFLIIFLGKVFSRTLLRQMPFHPYVTLTILSTYFRIGFELICLQYLRAKGEPKKYLLVNIVSFIIFVSLQYIFVAIVKWGITGALWGELIKTVVMAILYAILMLKEFSFKLDMAYIKTALSYSLPLIPHRLSNWGLNLADRVILEQFVSLTEIGIYSLADNFRQGYQMIANSFETATRPIYGRAGKYKEIRRILPTFITYYLLLLISVGMTIVVFSPEILMAIASPEYDFAKRIIPWLILGMLFQGFYWVPMNILTQFLGKTKGIAWVTFFAGVINIVLNIVFVPRYGILAAAVNTSVGYLVLFLLMFHVANQNSQLDFESVRIGKALMLACIFVSITLMLKINVTYLNTLFKLFMVILFPFGLYLSNFFNQQEKMWIKSSLNLTSKSDTKN